MNYLYFSDKDITYSGEQLRSHWIYETFNILGDAIVGFTGEANVQLDKMVDIQDILAREHIYSKKMLHFLIEHFNSSMCEIILRQRLFITILKDLLNNLVSHDTVLRSGDDLFFQEGKLSVSIATLSPVSGLIHVGINITSESAPVKAAGLLSEMNIININDFAIQAMKYYTMENNEILKAGYKVKPVM